MGCCCSADKTRRRKAARAKVHTVVRGAESDGADDGDADNAHGLNANSAGGGAGANHHHHHGAGGRRRSVLEMYVYNEDPTQQGFTGDIQHAESGDYPAMQTARSGRVSPSHSHVSSGTAQGNQSGQKSQQHKYSPSSSVVPGAAAGQEQADGEKQGTRRVINEPAVIIGDRSLLQPLPNQQDPQQQTPRSFLAFDVVSFDCGSFSELSLISSDDNDADMAARKTGADLQSLSALRTTSSGVATPQPQGDEAEDDAGELNTTTLDYIMSRIFHTTYHTPAMCLVDISTSGQHSLSPHHQHHSNSNVLVSERFSQVAFGKRSASASELIAWIFRKDYDQALFDKLDRSAKLSGAAPAEGEFQEEEEREEGEESEAKKKFTKLSPFISPQDRDFFSDQRKIMRRLITRPQLKGTETEIEDKDSDFDDTDSEYDPDEDLGQRTVEEGFVQIILPSSSAVHRGLDGEVHQGAVPLVATLYISTISAGTLPKEADLSKIMRNPSVVVISIVATRPLDAPKASYIQNELAEFPPSALVLREVESGTDFMPNTGPGMIRSPNFTGNVFVKTVTDPEEDQRIQPYFEGKNRKFEIQMQGRFTPTDNVDFKKGQLYFLCYCLDPMQLSFFNWTMIKGIAGAFRMIGRGGTLIKLGDEASCKVPMMGIPLLGVLDRLSIRGPPSALPDLPEKEQRKVAEADAKKGGSGIYKRPRRTPPLALGVNMLPETHELKHLKTVEKHDMKHTGKRLNYFEPNTSTYTMSFHSQYADFEAWKLRKVPGFKTLDMHTYWANQHPHISVVYLPDDCQAGGMDIFTKGTFILRLQGLHVNNVAAQEEEAARVAAEEAAAAAAAADGEADEHCERPASHARANTDDSVGDRI